MASREVACERHVMRMVVVVSLLAALGCSKSKSATAPMPQKKPAPVAEAEPTPAPPPGVVTDAQLEETMAKELVMFDAMAAAVDAAGTDCGRMADGLNMVFNDNVSLIAEERRYRESKEMKQRSEAWRKAHMELLLGPMMKIGTAMLECASDPKFAAFQQRFDEMTE